MRFKQFTTSRKQIADIMNNALSPEQYNIRPDGIVDVIDKGGIFIHKSFLVNGRLPIQFGTVEGNFIMDSVGATSLIGCPSVVNGKFNISDNMSITSLAGGPKEVHGGSYVLSFTSVASLADIAKITMQHAPAHVSGINVNTVGCVNLTSVESLVGIPSNLHSILFPSEMTSLVGVDTVIKQLLTGEVVINSRKITKGGIGLLLIDGLTEIKDSRQQLSEPFRIIEKYIGRPNDIFDCQVELFEKDFDDWAEL